jgi:hypothetical protein
MKQATAALGGRRQAQEEKPSWGKVSEIPVAEGIFKKSGGQELVCPPKFPELKK